MNKKGKIFLVFFALFLAIVFFRMVRDFKDIKFLETGECFKNIFCDDIYSQMQFNHGSVDAGDTICCYSINKTLNVLVWKVNEYSNISDTVSAVLKRNVSNFYLTTYDVIELPGKCKVSKKKIRENNRGIELEIKKGTETHSIGHNHIKFTTKKFGVGYKKERPSILFDFNKRMNDVDFIMKEFNNSNIMVALYSYSKENKVTIDLADILKNNE